MATATIDEKIRAYYQAESGEWLMEKGKIKEARLLKEAVECIESLNKRIDNLKAAEDKKDGLYHGWWKEEQKARMKMGKAVDKVSNRLSAVATYSERLNESLTECNESIAALAKDMEEIEDLSY